MSDELAITRFAVGDEPDLFAAYAAVVEDGGSFPRRPPADLLTFRSAWLEGAASIQVARLGGEFVGSYFLRPNFPGSAAHIANAGYLVAHGFRGCGFGHTLAEHSLAEARKLGFDAMMFNLVLEGNPSRRLWERLGFVQIGRVPDAVDGQDGLIYWQSLTADRIGDEI